jgi:hypothetical protein
VPQRWRRPAHRGDGSVRPALGLGRRRAGLEPGLQPLAVGESVIKC